MATLVLHPHHIFGFRRGVSNSLLFSDEHTLVFPSGNNCVRYNIDQQWQKFIPGIDKNHRIQALAISHNRRYLAVSERGERGTVTVYELQYEHSRKRKVLTSGDVSVREFVCVAFSHDSKYLVGQAAGPEWNLFYWAWEKQNFPMATVKSTNAGTINQVSFNPRDSTLICVSGKDKFKLFRYAEGALKQSNMVKLETHNILSHAWISEERVIAGTEKGRLLVFDSGDLRWQMSVAQEAERQEDHRKLDDTPLDLDLPPRVTAIVSYSKGFICSAGPGIICLFEKTENKDNYRKTKKIRIPPDPYRIDPSEAEQQEITHLCISPSEDTLATCTNQGQIYCVTLSSAVLSKGEEASFQFLSQSFHSGIITGLSVCIRKPLVATCSLDRSVRIWDYETNALELRKEFEEEAYSVALHPFGLFILVGFSDKLRLMNLLSDDFRTFEEFTLRGCRECVFSHGGHMFAAASGNMIHLYSTSTFDNILSLKGHNGKVRSVVWSPDDSRLVSCGIEGAVYEWDTLSGKRETESVLKACSYAGVALSPDRESIFAVGSDCTLKQIQGCQILKEMTSDNVAYTAIVMTHTGEALFIGTSRGTVRVIKNPLPMQKEWTEYQGHSGPITKMAVTFTNQYLLTASADGCLLIWKITDKEGHELRLDREIIYSEEILVTKSELKEKNQIILEFETRVKELQIENEYQLRLKDMDYNEKIKELTEKFKQQLELLETQNQVLKTENETEKVTHQKAMTEVKEKSDKEQREIEFRTNQTLMLEYEKYHELHVKSQQMQESYEKNLHETIKNSSVTLQDMKQFYETKLLDEGVILSQCQDESRLKVREFEEIIKQMEQDSDREQLHIRFKYESQLREERETVLRLKGEIGIMKKKVSSLRRDTEDRNLEIEKLKVEKQKLQGVSQSLEMDTTGLKREILERDETIHDKEKRISDLKRKNQELGKFKFVLDYRAKELKKQLELKDNEMKEMTQQIQKMEFELDQLLKNNAQLERTIGEMNLKLKATAKETHKDKQRIKDGETIVSRFKTDLHNCVSFIQEPKKLKDSIRELYHRYVLQTDMGEVVDVDVDIQQEFLRQKEFLKRNVASLKKKLAKDNEVHQADRSRFMKDNMTLFEETNNLRKELSQVQAHVHDYEAQHPTNKRNQSRNATDVKAASAGRQLSAKEDAERIIRLQRLEIQRLRQQCLGQQQGQTQTQTLALAPLSARIKLPALST